MTDTAPTIVNRTLPKRLPNSAYRVREYLTEKEVDRLIEAARKRGRNGARDAAAILLAYRRPIDPVFRADSVVLAISVEKDGNCGWSTPGSDAAKVVLLGEVLKLRWRGPTPPLRVTLGVKGAGPPPRYAY